MFKTFMGPVEEQAAVVYLRPETAQGIYVNFLNVLSSPRGRRFPFGIAQIGKAFRNEITPGNFIFRTREFEQMEMQFFVKPGTDAEWFEYWKERRMEWHQRAGPRPGAAALAPARPRASWRTTPARRSTCSSTSRSAGRRSRASTTAATSTSAATRSTPARSWSTSTRRRTSGIVPYIVETSAGADRVTLTLLVNAYREEEVEGETRVVLGFHPALAPIKAGVFPLVKKDGMPEFAHELYHDLRAAVPRVLRRQRRHRPPLPPAGRGGHAVLHHRGRADDLADRTVTVRDRDTMQQERVALDQVGDYIAERVGAPSMSSRARSLSSRATTLSSRANARDLLRSGKIPHVRSG